MRARPARAGLDSRYAARVTRHVVRDRDRIANGLNDIVVYRLFSAGLDLEMAAGLMGDHPGVGKVHRALAEIDLAIRDIRTVLFDHLQAVPGCGDQPD